MRTLLRLSLCLPLCFLLCLAVTGCGSDTTTVETPPVVEPAADAEPAKPRKRRISMAAEMAAATSSENEPTSPPEPETERVAAETGVGKKGRGYGGGIVSEPVRQYFRTGQRIVFEIQIPKALREFAALDPNGKGPQSHEIFMDKIVNEIGIQLPELPVGEKYVWDPEKQELFVEKPRS